MDHNYHCNLFGKNILNLFQSGAKADVASKINESTICAHKFIPKINSPAIARLCDGTDRLNRPVHISGTSPDAFNHFLRYIYGGEAPETYDIVRMCEDLIITAYRFGVNSLKMEVERTLVACCVVDVSNCIDFILFSDKNKCPFLKEHAISYLVERSNDVLNSESSEKLKQSSELMHEIMVAMASNSIVQKQTIKGQRRSKKGRKKNSNKQKTSSRAQTKQAQHEKKGTKSRQVSPLQSELEKVCTVSGGHALDAEKVRSEARRILQVAEGHALDAEQVRRKARRVLQAADNSLRKPGSHYLRMHGNNRCIVNTYD